MRENVQITVSRDIALMMVGWLQAKRPEGDWDPVFLTVFLDTLNESVSK